MVCVWVGFLKCEFAYVWILYCVVVCICVCVCLCVCNVWMCVCLDFVMSGCMYVCVL